MPNLVPVTLAYGDRSFNFEPVSLKDGLGTLVDETSAANPSLAPVITLSVVRPSKTSRLKKTRMRINMPYAKIVSGNFTTTKDRDSSVDITITTAEHAPPEDREELKNLLTAALADLMIKEALIDGKSLY